ncbi:MAG: hypothetical protein WD872_17275 [Pirellulaceae bacterium]
MDPITIPTSLVSVFGVTQPARVCDEDGNVLGYYTPRREATEADYDWAMNNITKEEIEASLASGPGRPLAEILADLRSKYGP